MGHQGEYQERGPCLDKDGDDLKVGNIPYDAEDLYVVTKECGSENRRSCPVAQVTATIFENMCGKVLARLTAKFGAPVHHAVTVQNGFGARWTQHHYFWKFASGDLIYYDMHEEIDGGPCHLDANTREFRANVEKQPEVKF